MRQRFRALHSLALFAVLLAACGGRGGSPENPLVVRMLYGSEKQGWIETATEQFHATRPRSTTNRPIRVEAQPIGSAESLEQILDGRERPAVWSPASSLLLPTANERWGRQNAGTRLVDPRPAPLVLSPVVIAMWRPMAEALGWPERPLGWGDIADLTRGGQSWADFGHPEWGPFQFGHTHPDWSNSGIVSVVATAYAGAGKTRGLTVDDVQRPETSAFLAGVEGNVIHYGESTGFFARQMFTRGPAYLSAAVLYENLVVESYDQSLYPNRSLAVVAVYPKEGTFWSDHPFGILEAPWVDAELRAAAEAYRDFLLARPQQERALGFGFRPADPRVAIGAPIHAERGVDPAEPRTLLENPSAEVLDATRALWQRNKKRVEVQVVVDVSGSMNEEGRLEQAKTALARFVDVLDDQDRLGITVFNDQARVVAPIEPLVGNRQALQSKIAGLFPSGGTRLNDTVVEAYHQMQASPPGERIRAIVVLSDGADNRSQAKGEQLRQLLAADERGQSIKVFTIAYGTRTNVDVGLLRTIAESSGAKSYTSDPREIERVYRDIATFF